MESVHGLKIIAWMSENNPMEKSALLKALRQEFGEESTFHTCSATEFPLEDLLEFFVSNGKLDATDGKFGVPADFACDC